MSSVFSFACSASAGLIQTALSHVILFCGFGNSCSQPLFENDPSQIAGSGRNMISRPELLLAGVAGGVFAATLMAGSAVSATMPSCSDFCQKMSKFCALFCDCQ